MVQMKSKCPDEEIACHDRRCQSRTIPVPVADASRAGGDQALVLQGWARYGAAIQYVTQFVGLDCGECGMERVESCGRPSRWVPASRMAVRELNASWA
nr:hypothetical protein CFP56_33464 [Quercus suber]